MRPLLALLVGAFVIAGPGSASAEAPAEIAPASAPPAVQTPYHTEEEWIVSSVCRNAFELLAFAADKKGELISPAQVVLKKIPGDTLSYEVTVKGAQATAEATLKWTDTMSLWAPAAYVPFCQAAAQALKLPPARSAEAQGDPLHTLLEFSESAIEAENRRISQWLAAQPDNASAHEQAALDLGVLAMKENSGYFWDPRGICNQVCAHLAVAKFLRGNAPTSIEGRLADITIGLIVDTKAQTARDLDALSTEKSPPPELAAWLNACRMRNSRDWRIVATLRDRGRRSEQVEYFRAYCEAVDVNHGVTWLQSRKLPDRIDWTRIVLENDFRPISGRPTRPIPWRGKSARCKRLFRGALPAKASSRS